LSRAQLDSLPLLKAARDFVRGMRQRAISSWAVEGFSAERLSVLYGLSKRQVERILAEPFSPAGDGMRRFLDLIRRAPPRTQEFLYKCILGWSTPGFADAVGNPQPFIGIPRYAYPADPQPYHSWVSSNDLERIFQYAKKTARIQESLRAPTSPA